MRNNNAKRFFCQREDIEKISNCPYCKFDQIPTYLQIYESPPNFLLGFLEKESIPCLCVWYRLKTLTECSVLFFHMKIMTYGLLTGYKIFYTLFKGLHSYF